MNKIGFGGGCHWCTEAVFQSLIGVEEVEQGYVASSGENDTFSEAVIVQFNEAYISLQTLIEIHLYTHKSTSNHSMREKYRSAIYVFSEDQKVEIVFLFNMFQKQFENRLVTKVLAFKSFIPSREEITNYYQKNPDKPFCKQFINPKLQLILKRFTKHVDHKTIHNLKILNQAL